VHSRAILLQVIAALMFSSGGLVIKLITVSPQAVVGVRGAIAAIIIALFMRKANFRWSLSQIGGAVALGATQFFFVLATTQTTAANAIFIQYTAPIYVAIFGIWYLHEKLRWLDGLSIIAVFAGLALFFWGNLDATALRGNINAVISGITYAWFILFLRRQKDSSTIETVFLGNALIALIFTPFIFFESPTFNDWLALGFLGVLQLGIPFVLMSVSIRSLTAVEAILIQALEPIMNPVWVFLVIGEKPSSFALAGALVVLIAVTLRAVFRRKEEGGRR
jgi:drug/metabolite transporter (DMT)-like permease